MRTDFHVKNENQTHNLKMARKAMPSLNERGIAKIEVLHNAKRIDNDEFYTRYEDVERELSMYPMSIWKNKTVFCNSDDAVDDKSQNTSAFALYFLRNFNKLALKQLICTHYSGRVDLFNQGAKGYVFTKTGFREFYEYTEGYTGSFDHPLSLKILREEADIVCTNPPFSKAIDYWRMIITSGKKFIIVSNIVSAISTAYLPYFMEHKVWAGYNEVDWFLTPKNELARASGYWFTNIPIKDRPKCKQLKIMPLNDIPTKCKKYDDNRILLVDNCYIPSDYKNTFAVSTRPILNGLLEKGYEIVHDKQYDPPVNGKICFKRVLVKKTT